MKTLRKFLFLVTPFLIPSALQAQTVGLTAGIDCGPNGSSVCTSIFTENFTDILAMQYSMHFDTAVITFDSVHIDTLLTAAQINTSMAGSGTLSFSWIDPGFTGVTVADSTVLYQLCFTVNGDPGETTSITFDGNPVTIEFVNSSFQILSTNLTPGLVVVGGGSTNIWTAEGDALNWSDTANWCNNVPISTEDVFIYYGECNLDIPPVMSSLTVNGGELQLTSGDTVETGAPVLINTNGTLNIESGTLEFNGPFENNGCIKGNGILDTEDATVAGYGKVAPGASTGTLKVKGTYCNEELAMELDGNNVPENDFLEVTQMVELGGELNLIYLGGTLQPATRVLVECPEPGCMSGNFATVNYPQECLGSCSVEVTSQQVLLTNTLPIEFIGTCTWMGGTGNWSDASNWSCNDVPGANDTVIVNAGQVTLDVPVTVASFNLSGGEITGNEKLIINGNLQWSGGQLNATDTTQVQSVELTSSASLANGTLIINGTGNWTDGSLTLSGNAFLNVATGALLQITVNAPNSIEASGSGGELIVQGNLVKEGTATFTINLPCRLNGGSILAQVGVLVFNNQLTYSGTIGGNGTIDLTNTIVQAQPGGNFSPGASPGTLNVQGDYANNVLNMEISESNGVVSKDLLSVTGNIDLNGSILNMLSTGTIPVGTFELLTFTGNPGNTEFATFNAPLCGNCNIEYTGNVISISNTQVCVPNLLLENMTLLTGTYLSLGELRASMSSVENGNTVMVKSDTGILLEQDFTVELGGVFEIDIQSCQ